MLIQKSGQSFHVLAKTDHSVLFTAKVKRSCFAKQ